MKASLLVPLTLRPLLLTRCHGYLNSGAVTAEAFHTACLLFRVHFVSVLGISISRPLFMPHVLVAHSRVAISAPLQIPPLTLPDSRREPVQPGRVTRELSPSPPIPHLPNLPLPTLPSPLQSPSPCPSPSPPRAIFLLRP